METHQDQPTFHLFDGSGWVNDPNGPLYYNGKYHMFFQNVEDSTTWTWGLSWGHATSTDLLHWRQQPAALKPDPGWHDADGCFSGCATVDVDGTPAILYTGVRKKPDAAEREGMPMTVSKLCYETQLIARPKDPSDPDLKEWVKVPEPFLPDDMSNLPTHCFRDPFVLEKPSESNGWRWRVMVGSNISVMREHHSGPGALPTVDSSDAESANGDKDSSSSSSSVVSGVQDVVGAAGGHEETYGTATVYRSKTKELEGGWEFDGLLCVAGPGDGAIWECPIMVPLAADTQIADSTVAEEPAATGAASNTAAAAAAAGGGGGGDGSMSHSATTSQAEPGAGLSKQQQQQLEMERAMSGCLGLWSPPNTPTSNSSNSNAVMPFAGQATDARQQQQQQMAALPPTHLFSVSAGVCPAIYWLGRYADGRFDLDAAEGPLALDLGDVLYAPNLLEDAQGRQIIWGWCQDHPSPVSHDYAGCISLPRQLTLGVKHSHTATPHSTTATPTTITATSSTLGQAAQPVQPVQPVQAGQSVQPLMYPSQQQQQNQLPPDGEGPQQQQQQQQQQRDVEYYLIQRPLPELDRLRSGRGLRLKGIVLPPGHVWSLPSQVSASHLDLTLTLQPRPGVKRFQILLGPLRKGTDTQQQQQQQQQQQRQQQQQQADASPAGPQDSLTPPAAEGTVPTAAAAGSGDVMPQSFVPVARNISGKVSGNFSSTGPSELGARQVSESAALMSETGVSSTSGSITLGAFIAGNLSNNSTAGTANPGFQALSVSSSGPGELAGGVHLPPLAAAAGDSGGGIVVESAAAAALSIDSFIGSGGIGFSSGRGLGFGGLKGSKLGGSRDSFGSLPGSPSGQEVLPWLPVTGNAAAAAVGGGAGKSSAVDDASQAAFGGSSAGVPTPAATAAGDSADGNSSSAAAAGLGAGRMGKRPGSSSSLNPTSPTSPHPDSAAALAAAAAAEALAQEHWQSAALTYDFETSQLQVLVGPPDALLKLLKQQADDLTAAEAAAAATASAAAGSGPSSTGSGQHGLDQQNRQQQHQQQQHQQHLSSRTGTPTPEKLGYDVPALPPAPSGALADSIAAAQAAGIRVLACQLRGLDPGEPLVMRMLLDYSILEVFFGTGEALTTRVYRGAPTARAAEIAARKSAATLSALEHSDTTSEVSMSGSLANLGLLLHHTHSLQHSISISSPRHLQHSLSANARLFGPLYGLGLNSRSSGSWGNLVGLGLGVRTPGSPRVFSPAGRHSMDVASLPSYSPAAAATAAAAGTTGYHADEGLSSVGFMSPPRRCSLPTLPSTAEQPLTASTAAAADQSPSTLLRLPEQEQQQQQQPVLSTALPLSSPFSPPPPLGSVSTRQAVSAVPPSPVGGGPYVHYFSPNRSLAAKVTGRPGVAALLPGLAGMPGPAGVAGVEDSAPAARAAAPAARVGGVFQQPASAVPGIDAVDSGAVAVGSDAGGMQQQQQQQEEGDGLVERESSGGGFGVGVFGNGGTGSSSSRVQRRKPFAEASFNAGVAAELVANGGSSCSAGPSSSSTSFQPTTVQPTAPTASDSAFAKANVAANDRSGIDMFPGFSPHKTTPAARVNSSHSSSSSGSSSSSTAGALVTWFQKKISSKGRKGEAAGDDNTSSTSTTVKHQIVLPPNFGVPPARRPSPFLGQGVPLGQTGSGSAAAAAADVPSAGGRDQAPKAHQQQQKQQQAKKAAGLTIIIPGASSSSSSSSSSTAPAAAVVPAPAALPTLQIRTARKDGSSSEGSTPAAAAGGGGGGVDESEGVSSPTGGVTSPTGGVLSPTRSPRSARAAGRSPGGRKNWRAAFVFDEDESGGTADGVPPALTGFDSWPMGLLPGSTGSTAATGSTATNTIGSRVGGMVGGTVGALLPGLEGSRVLVNTIGHGATAISEPTWESEYGLYAQLLAPGTKSTTTGTAGSTATSAVLQPSAAAGSGSSRGVGIGGGVRVSLGPVGSSSGKPSTYSVGSMRECSLVALGAGGVTVQRLEAYEMASMWDPEDAL